MATIQVVAPKHEVQPRQAQRNNVDHSKTSSKIWDIDDATNDNVTARGLQTK